LPVTVSASGGPSLIDKMSKLQYFTHKSGLSLKAGNKDLATFYIHELEETIEDLELFGQYKQFDIGKMIKKVLLPEFKGLEKAFKSGDTESTWQAFNALIKSCNSCHQSTRHGFIKIRFNDENPYMQSFEK
jgi:hypothetical protein